MSWFDKWIAKKVRQAWDSAGEDYQPRENKVRRGIPISTREIGSELSAKGLRFNLYRAVGGHILETHIYDNRTDESRNTLYMINEEDDFAKQVAQAIMVESMKQ
jgi:hypothetical protein